MSKRLVISNEQYRVLQLVPTPRQLFDFEIETLVAKELAEYHHADKLRHYLPNKLFLFIPHRNQELDLEHLMRLVELDDECGVNRLNIAPLSDNVEVPEESYFMHDVEDGSSRLGVKPSVAKSEILADRRSPYVTFEGIIHGILFPSILKHHSMDLVGSRCGNEGVPHLCLCGSTPMLTRSGVDIVDRESGAPSCRQRIIRTSRWMD